MVKWGKGEAKKGFDFRSCDDCEIAIQIINFNDQEQAMRGAGGHPGDVVTAHEAWEELQKPEPPGVLKQAIVCWETCDGLIQISLYDFATFDSEVYGPIGKVGRKK